MVTDNTNQADDTTAFLRAARSGNLEKVIEYLDTNLDINTSNSNGLNALHLASKDGHVEIVTELLKRGAKVDAATKKGNTALHIASLAGQAEIVNILLQYGAAVNIQSQNGFTPLYMAAQENHDQVVKILLCNEANQSLATEDGFTPLAVAMQQGHDKVVSVLLENDSKGKVRLPALHIAAKKDDCKAADLLLQNDHKPDVTSKSGFTPLHIAAHYGNEEIARLLIKRGADVNYLAKHNISPLHVAAKWGKNNMVKILLENSAMIDAKTRDGLTPLHCAARSGHDQVVSTLLENSAPISARTKNGLAPLHMASQGDHVDAARVLLYHRAPVDEVTIDYLTSLHVAAHCGHVRVAKLLLDRKADPNARALNGFTPLHIACKKNRIKVVELLLKHGASIESTTESGLTPLHVASFMGCMNIVIFLLQHEANPDVPTVRGETPLHLAARANQTDIIRILLRNGAKVDARAREQQTPLHIASRLGNVDIVMLLLQHGAAVDTTTKDMYTALHIAAKEGQEEVAAILVENNASLKASTKNGFTPLHIAAKYGNINVAKILLQKDSALDAHGKNEITPLHMACHYDHPNVATLLLDKGASPHVASQNGLTPLHIAARKNQMDIASTLLEHGANANVESKAGFTPLHLSAQRGHYDMTNLLIEHGADPNHRAKNGLTALHLCAQEDFIRVASILVKNGANVESQTETGYRPIHVAAHFGNLSMIRFLLKHNAEIDVRTDQNYTPLHQAAQQGHAHIASALLEGNASQKARTKDGLTALNIAQKLGYISVMEVLKGLSYDNLAPNNKNWEEKYKVIAPESLQETNFMSDSDDEGGSDTLISEQPYRYLTADLMKSLRDDSLPIDVTRDDPIHRQVLKEDKQEFVQSSNYCSAENFDMQDSMNLGRLHFRSFLVSFLVDARGGAMKGCRHSGIRIIVPPRRATMPIRVTCRLVKPSKISNPPPLMEGEALATRIIEMGPVSATFLGPVLIDVPHFASVQGKEREIIILRSENGETWKEHDNSADNDDTLMNTPYDPQMSTSYAGRITRIITTDFPQYFAIVTRIKQEIHVIGAEGGILISSVVDHVQAVFPPGALTKKIKVGLQAHVIPAELTAKLLGNCVAVSPVITIEPRRRKFHKPITLTIPVPQAANKGMINQYGGETPTLRLLCSIAGGTSEAQWEDVTGSTPLTFMNDRVSFTTTVSARFWLMDCRNIGEVPKMATELYKESLFVPFITNFVIYSKRMDLLEATLRILCMTDGKEGMHTLEKQEEFLEIVKSRDVEALDGKDLYIEFSGNLVPVTKSGVQLKFTFKAFRQNRLSFHVKVKDPLLDPVARMLFMREPKIAKGEPPQQPICILNIVLPEIMSTTKIQGKLDGKMDFEDSNIISQKIDRFQSQYQKDNKEKSDEPKSTSPCEQKFITDTLQKEQTDAATIHEFLAQKAASCPLESVDASYLNKIGSAEGYDDKSPINEKQTYSEKRKFWEDITRKRDSYQRSESEVSRTSQLTINESDSECMQNVVSEEDTEAISGRSETMEDMNIPDISECSVAEKAHYFEEQIQREMTLARMAPKLQSQDSIREKDKSVKDSKADEAAEEAAQQPGEEVLNTGATYSQEVERIERLGIEEREEFREEAVLSKRTQEIRSEDIRKTLKEESVRGETVRFVGEEKFMGQTFDSAILNKTDIIEISKDFIKREKTVDDTSEDSTVGQSEDRKTSSTAGQSQIDSKEVLADTSKKVTEQISKEDQIIVHGEKEIPVTKEIIGVCRDMLMEERKRAGQDIAEMETLEKIKERIEEGAERPVVFEKMHKKATPKEDREVVFEKMNIKSKSQEAEEKEIERKEVEKKEIEEKDFEERIKETKKAESGKEPIKEDASTKKAEEWVREEEIFERIKDVSSSISFCKEMIMHERKFSQDVEKERLKEIKVKDVSTDQMSKHVDDIQQKVDTFQSEITVEFKRDVKESMAERADVDSKQMDVLSEKLSEMNIKMEDDNKLRKEHAIEETKKSEMDAKIFSSAEAKEKQIRRDFERQLSSDTNMEQNIVEDKELKEPKDKTCKDEKTVTSTASKLKSEILEKTEMRESSIVEGDERRLFKEFEARHNLEELIPKDGMTFESKEMSSTVEKGTMEMHLDEEKQVKKEFESRIPISAAKAEKDRTQKIKDEPATKIPLPSEAKRSDQKLSPKSEETKDDLKTEKQEASSVSEKRKEFESRIPKRIHDVSPAAASDKDAKKDLPKKEFETRSVTETKRTEEVTSSQQYEHTSKSESQTYSKTFTAVDPREAFRVFEGMSATKRPSDFETMTSKVDHKASSRMEAKEVISSEVTSGADKIIVHEEKEHVEKRKTSEKTLTKESPTETIEEKEKRVKESDSRGVQKTSVQFRDGKEIIDASATQSGMESREEQRFKSLEDKDGIAMEESGMSRVKEKDVGVSFKIEKDLKEAEKGLGNVKQSDEILARIADVRKAVREAIVQEEMLQEDSRGVRIKEYHVTTVIPKDSATGTAGTRTQEDLADLSTEVPETLEEKHQKTVKEYEARNIAETIIQSIETEIENRVIAPEATASEKAEEGYESEVKKSMTKNYDFDDEELADDLTKQFESIMQRSGTFQTNVTSYGTEHGVTERLKSVSGKSEDLFEKESTRDSISISEDLTKDEESSPQEKDDSLPFSSSQTRLQDRDITMSPSSMSEHIELEESLEVESNELEDIPKFVGLDSAEKKDEAPPTESTRKMLLRKASSYEHSGARVLEILEPEVKEELRQDSMDVPSLEMDEQRSYEQPKDSSGTSYEQSSNEKVSSLHESAAVHSLERIGHDRDITVSPSTVSEQTDTDYSLPHERSASAGAKEFETGMRRSDSFEMESPPLISPRAKAKVLEIKPVNWMIGDEKIEISETLQPSQAFDKELDEYQSRKMQSFGSQKDESLEFTEPEGSITKSSGDLSAVDSVKEATVTEIYKTHSGRATKFTVIPVSDQELENELVENKLDTSCQELMDTLQREYDAKTPTEGYGMDEHEKLEEVQEKLQAEVTTSETVMEKYDEVEDKESTEAAEEEMEMTTDITDESEKLMKEHKKEKRDDNVPEKDSLHEITTSDSSVRNPEYYKADNSEMELHSSKEKETLKTSGEMKIEEKEKDDTECHVEPEVKPERVVKEIEKSVDKIKSKTKSKDRDTCTASKSSHDDSKKHGDKTIEKPERLGHAPIPPHISAFKMKKEDTRSVDLSARYAITVLDQVVKKEIAEVKESLEAAQQDLIEELTENNETVFQIKDSPSEFQFKLQPESIPNDLPFLYKAPSVEQVSDAEPSTGSPVAKPRVQVESIETRDTPKVSEIIQEPSKMEQFEKTEKKEETTLTTEIDKSEIKTETQIAVHTKVAEQLDETQPVPVPASRSSSDVDNKDDSFSLIPPQPAPRRRHKPARASKKVTSESEGELGSSSGESSNYHSCDYEIGSGSRPSSSDIDALQSCIPSGTVSEYETALMSIEHSSGSRPTSQDYHTAVSSLSSRESIKSLNSLSSGHLGSIDSTSELSETLVASEADIDKDVIDENLETALDDDLMTNVVSASKTSDSPIDESPVNEHCSKAPSEMPCRMKRSSEMIFQQILDDNGEPAPVESEEQSMTQEHKFSDSSTSTLAQPPGVLQSVDIMTSRVIEDGVQSVCTQVISKEEATVVQEDVSASVMTKQEVVKTEAISMDADSLEPKLSSIGDSIEDAAEGLQSSMLSIIQQASMSTSSTSGMSMETVIEKEKSDRHSPDSDSFELVDKPDIIDDFVVIEEVGKEAEEFDSEGKSIQISALSYTTSKNYDRDLENLITENKDDSQVSTSQASRNNDLFDFESEESPPQASNDDQYSQSYSDEEQYEGKKWIEMQFHNDPRAYDIEYDRGPLEDIKEEEITDFEAGSSRFGSLGSHKESIGSVGSMRGSLGSTPDYDVLAGRKYLVKPSDHDNISLSSLQEFEHLESAVALENAKKLQCGSQDSINNGSLPRRYVTGKSGHGDDISLSSLKDFEGLEYACKEAHKAELKAREEEDLLDHESPENRYKLESLLRARAESSAPGSINPSTSGSDDYEKRIKEIDEIIRIAQANVEKFDRQDDTTEDISQIEITDVEKIGSAAATVPLEIDNAQTSKEANIMETSTDSLELEENPEKKHHPLCRSSDSLEMKTTLDYPSLSSDSLNNVRDVKEAHFDAADQFNNMRRISSDSLEMPFTEQEESTSQEKVGESNSNNSIATVDKTKDQTSLTGTSVADSSKAKSSPASNT
ncbi:ankyrin-2 isoform X2 [Cephus cinctus]|uniref:Ankyrin-2 isoform X2 n=1 Tax=Cephus cinctus TaxID=211228 RepID=A0AAJ7FFX9_CEPCN|nr:ankyrin-2 isoform X2 [Cephus cinctus]